MSPVAQGEVARLLREDTERKTAKQAEIESKRLADELERGEKLKSEKELKAATAAKLKDHRRPQQGDRAEYQVQPIGPDCRQQWPTDEEIRANLRNDPRTSGTLYGTHFAMRFTQANGPYSDAASRRPRGCCASRTMSTQSLRLAQRNHLDRNPAYIRASWVFRGRGLPSCGR